MQTIIICSYDGQLLPEKKTPEAMCRDIRTAEDVTLQPWAESKALFLSDDAVKCMLEAHFLSKMDWC